MGEGLGERAESAAKLPATSLPKPTAGFPRNPAVVFAVARQPRNSPMRWGTYFAVCAAVISIGLALGVTMPLVSLRLESWGYDSFAIGVMAAPPAVGVLHGTLLAGVIAARSGT